MITIFTIAYNESVLMKFMIDHYRSKFPNCRIVVYDNMSTDGCDKIASYNIKTEKTFLYCATHKKENMVNIRNK